MTQSSRRSTVYFDGAEYEVTINQKSKYSWLVTGDFKGRHLSEDGRSEQQALDKWKRAASYKDDYR